MDVKQTCISTLRFIENDGNAVYHCMKDKEVIIHWGLKEVVMSEKEAQTLCTMIKTLTDT